MKNSSSLCPQVCSPRIDFRQSGLQSRWSNIFSHARALGPFLCGLCLVYTLWSLSRTCWERRKRERWEAAKSSVPLPFPKSHLISRKSLIRTRSVHSPTQPEPTGLCNLFWKFPLLLKAGKLFFWITTDRERWNITLLGGAATLQMKALFPIPQAWILLEWKGRKKKKKKRREKENIREKKNTWTRERR